MLKSAVEFLNHIVWSVPEPLPWLVVVLLACGFYVTVRLGFIQLFQVRHATRVVLGKYDDPSHAGDINHFQALSTALSATVGIGNIAGVAVAIHLGGPGAIFWMWVTAVFGMALKFTECTLSMHYRAFDEHGNAAGGPMYYIEKGLGRRWKPLAVMFAVCGIVASFGGGNMNQANTVALSARADLGLNEYLVGAIAAALVGAVILGGIQRIGKVSSKLAPGMAIMYVAAALVVLVLHLPDIPGAFVTILSDAFTPEASLGGSVAGGIMTTLVWGVKRGLFSNEAGQGSAPIAHAAAKTDEPVREGAVAMLGPLIDTLIICTMTALVIVVTGVWDEKHPGTLPASAVRLVPVTSGANEYLRVQGGLAAAENFMEKTVHLVDGRTSSFDVVAYDGLVESPVLKGAEGPLHGAFRWTQHGLFSGQHAVSFTVEGKSLLTSSALTAAAFQRGLPGDWGNFVVTLAVFLFALSTMISWSYYGDRCVVYLWGYKWVPVYRMVYVVFVFVGSVVSLRVVWEYGDLAMGLMTVPNLIAVTLLTPKVVAITRDYFARGGAAHG